MIDKQKCPSLFFCYNLSDIMSNSSFLFTLHHSWEMRRWVNINENYISFWIYKGYRAASLWWCWTDGIFNFKKTATWTISYSRFVTLSIFHHWRIMIWPSRSGPDYHRMLHDKAIILQTIVKMNTLCHYETIWTTDLVSCGIFFKVLQTYVEQTQLFKKIISWMQATPR